MESTGTSGSKTVSRMDNIFSSVIVSISVIKNMLLLVVTYQTLLG
jgi:hypothetical protein